jgi:CBS domain containing-hemolysin-like protein
MEEIFGEIDDEHDTEEFTEKIIDKSHYIFSARLEIDYLNEKYGLKLPISDEYETLGGLIINYHESIPELNQIIKIDDYQFSINKVTKNKIEEVKLSVVEDN